VVDFGLCKESAVVEKKLYEQSSSLCTPFWALIMSHISSEDRMFLRKRCTILKLVRKWIAWHVV